MFPVFAAAAIGLFGRRRRRRPKVTVNRPPVIRDPQRDELIDAYTPPPIRDIPQSSGYLMITDKDDQETQYLGRILEFDVDRGTAGDLLRGNRQGDPEKVLLDGHVIYETQITFPTQRKLQQQFMQEFDVQQLSASQVSNILAEDENDPQMFGDTAALDQAMEQNIESQLDNLREEMEAEYMERFEREYQARFKQEYPGKFSSDYQDHYTDMVQDELDDVVEDHEELYHEYIVTPKHIRYKR